MNTIADSAHAVLSNFGFEDYASIFLAESDGLALLALLCNAGAKGLCGPADPALYIHKAVLVTAACNAANRADWWRDDHDSTAVYFIETGFGQVSFHFRSADQQPDLPNPPTANGRRWCGVSRQALAAAIATLWLAERL